MISDSWTAGVAGVGLGLYSGGERTQMEMELVDNFCRSNHVHCFLARLSVYTLEQSFCLASHFTSKEGKRTHPSKVVVAGLALRFRFRDRPCGHSPCSTTPLTTPRACPPNRC